jgi:hypothetical protein
MLKTIESIKNSKNFFDLYKVAEENNFLKNILKMYTYFGFPHDFPELASSPNKLWQA